MDNNPTYKLIVWNRHILIELNNGYLVIDTGSPQSFHKDGLITIGEKNFNVPNSIMGIDSAYLSNQLNYDIAGLIGMDIMNEFSVWFNSPVFGNFIGFHDKTDYEGEKSVCPNLLGCPCIEMTVNKRKGVFLFDSGAPISYVSSKFLSEEIECGKTTDFSPLLKTEQFEVSLFYLGTNISIGNGDNAVFNAIYAKMPDQLEMILSVYQIDGIIGFDLINNNRLIVTEGSVVFPPH